MLSRCNAAPFVCLLAALPLAAADTASLRGRVTDATGAAVAGASVTATHAATKFAVRAKSAADGAFHLLLAPGRHDVAVEYAGFKTARFAIDLTVRQTMTRDVTLEVGAIAESITVDDGGGRRGRKLRRELEPPIHRFPPDAEEYAPIREEGFQQVSRAPLSTFSSDVDTAAYSNIRRFLRDGQLPPADAVRIEEMLNYFRYSYPEPAGGKPVSISVEMARCPWQPANLLARVGLRARSIDRSKLPPSNIVFLIDVSGSMAPENKLPLLRKALGLVVDQLRAEDHVSIVVYAGSAGLVLPPASGSDKARIRAALDSLSAGGSTAGGAGIRLAYQTAREQFIRGGNNRVILATDGDFNVGVSSEQDLTRLIESEREHGVFLTVLGFGYGNLKDAKLETLAKHGNGNHAYVDSLLEARKVLVEGFGGTLFTVATDVKLQVEFNPAFVRSYRLIGYENRRLAPEDFKDDAKDAGEMGSGHTVTALYELVPANAPPAVDPLRYQTARAAALPAMPASGEAMFVKVRYKNPEGAESHEITQPLPYEPRAMAHASEDMRLAAAVAEFGMVLRKSKDRGAANLDSAARLASTAIGADSSGHRAELLFLIQTTRGLR